MPISFNGTNTMPISFNGMERPKRKLRDSPSDNSGNKHRVKPKSAKGKAPEIMSVRMWSAATKQKNKLMDVPIIITKKEKNSVSFSNSRRDKPKLEEEKKEMIFEDKRKTYFKKNNDKRAQSSNNKVKLSMALPFQSSLEPEFLNLFAKGEEFNF